MGKTLSCFLLGLIFFAPLAAPAQTNNSDYRQMGEALYQKGLYNKALNYFNQAVQADSNDWQAYQELGDTYMKLNDDSSALDAYNKSLQINPNNASLKATVDNLQETTTPANPKDQSNFNTLRQDHPAMANPKPWRNAAGAYNDQLGPMSHSRSWLSVDMGYTYTNLGDLATSADYVNAQIASSGTYTGLATADHNGFNIGAELGFLLNPYNGIALGVRAIAPNPYTSDINFQDSYGDYEDISIQPYLVPLTLDYYLFLPDQGGRFYLSAGVGYYVSSVHVDDAYTVSNGANVDEIIGDLYSGNVGFQLGIGREFAINNHFGLRIFARGRYAKISGYRGTVTDANGNTADFGLVQDSSGYVFVDNVGNIGGPTAEHFATIDYTSFDLGVAFTFF